MSQQIQYPVGIGQDPEGEPDAETMTIIRDATGRMLDVEEIVMVLNNARETNALLVGDPPSETTLSATRLTIQKAVSDYTRRTPPHLRDCDVLTGHIIRALENAAPQGGGGSQPVDREHGVTLSPGNSGAIGDQIPAVLPAGAAPVISSDKRERLWDIAGMLEFQATQALAMGELNVKIDAMTIVPKIVEVMRAASGPEVHSARGESFQAWLDTYKPGQDEPDFPKRFDRGDMAACWYASQRAEKATP